MRPVHDNPVLVYISSKFGTQGWALSACPDAGGLQAENVHSNSTGYPIGSGPVWTDGLPSSPKR